MISIYSPSYLPLYGTVKERERDRERERERNNGSNSQRESERERNKQNMVKNKRNQINNEDYEIKKGDKINKSYDLCIQEVHGHHFPRVCPALP